MTVKGSKGGCFAKGTLVLTNTGEVPIEDIKVGDTVVSFDDTGELKFGKVTNTWSHDNFPIYEFKVWGKKLYATDNHWVLNQYNKFAPIGTLTPEDAIVDQNNHLCPIIHKKYVRDDTVYNLTVEPYHTYIANGLRVHNGGQSEGRAKDFISGAKGGGKGGGGAAARAPVESPDSLQSVQYAAVLDLISEGEIEGLTNGLKSVYLDDTPVQNEDGSYNFSGVSIHTRNGTQDQTPIPGFDTTESEHVVNTEVTKAQSVTRRIVDPNVTHARITIGIPSLRYQNLNTGDITGTSVSYKISVQSNNSGFVPAKARIIRTSNNITYSVNNNIITINDANTAAGISFSIVWNRPITGTYYTWVRSNPRYNGWFYTYNQTRVAHNTYGGTPPTYLIEYKLSNSSTWTTYKTVTATSPVDNKEATTSTYITIPLSVDGVYDYRITQQNSSGTSTVSNLESLAYTGTITISGKSSSRYQRSTTIPLEGSAPWDIKVERITPDSNKANIANKTWWDTYTEIIDKSFRYPNSALVGLSIDSSQFNNIPSRGYDIKGLKVQVPTNYDPISRTYTGSWDGTFKVAWTDNPAWCFRDLILNPRYGLGEFITDAQVDKWTLYELAKYCDELVPDGFGGQEPRFTLNAYLQTQEEAYKVLQTLAAVFRGMVYWSLDQLTVVYDHPQTPAAIFTNSNVIDGEFQYTSSSDKARHTVVLVHWNDPKDLYKSKIEYVEDQDEVAKRGIIKTEITAFGTTSRGQAHRVGKWLLYTEKYENDVIAFSAGLDAAGIRPGQIIKVLDKYKAGKRYGGRIKDISATSVTIDDTITLDPNKSYTITLVLPTPATATRADGTQVEFNFGELVTRNIISSGTVNVLTFDTPLSTPLPLVGSIWALAENTLEPAEYRVLSITEDNKTKYNITAVTYNSSKYDYVENNLQLQELHTTSITTIPEAVTNLTLEETLYIKPDGTVDTKIIIDWEHAPFSTKYNVDIKKGVDGSWERVGYGISDSILEITGVTPDFYSARVYAVNYLGKESLPTEIGPIEVLGKTAPPADVTDFKIEGSKLIWSPVSDLDLAGYKIRYHSGKNTDYSSAIPLHTGILTDSPYNITQNISGVTTFLIKAVDTSGNESVNPGVIYANLGDVVVDNIIETIDEKLRGWPGTKTNLTVNSNNNLEAAVESTPIVYTGNNSSSFYSGVSSALLWGKIQYYQAIYETSIQPNNVTNNTALTLDYNITEASGVQIEYKKYSSLAMWSADTINPMWSADTTNPMWSQEPFTLWPGQVTATPEKYTFRITIPEQFVANTIEINKLNFILDAPDIMEYINDVTIPSGGGRLPITNNYTAIKVVNVTIQEQSGNTAFTARVIDKNPTLGPLIKCYDASGNSVSGLIDVIIQGY